MAEVKCQRAQMIRNLVAHSVSTALAEPQHQWLNDLFESGFIGYRNLSDRQLRVEMQLRGLNSSTYDDENDFDFEFDDDSDCEIADQERESRPFRSQARQAAKSSRED